MDGSGWCTIESDPGVFTELIESVGVRGVQVEELYSLDTEAIAQLKPVYGLIFLFKWTKETQRPDQATDAGEFPHIYFANQVINNACATQALISILMNARGIELGPHLSAFRAETMEFPADVKGLALGNSEQIRTSHNSFARAEPFVMEGFKDNDEDAYHFTAYMPIDGHLYEMDGLQRGPTHLGKLDSEAWWEQAQPMIQERISRYSSTEIHFNLLAVVKNRKLVLQERAAVLVPTRQALIDKILALGGDASGVPPNPLGDEAMTDAAALPVVEGSVEELQARANAVVSELEDIAEGVRAEDAKFRRWKMENTRRRQNYIPFIVSLLGELASRKLLSPLVDKATDRAKVRAARKAEKKAAGGEK